ncbi:MAG: FkbM family methyltransferase [Spirochaetales bacterium]
MSALSPPDSFDTRFDWLRLNAAGEADRRLLDRIYADRAMLLEKRTPPPDEWLPPLTVAGLRVRLPRRSAPASLDSLVEHLRDRVHARVPGFSASHAAVIVDVGANEGIYAACRFTENPAVRILSIEPVPKSFAVLIETVAGNSRAPSANRRSRFTAVLGLAADPTMARLPAVDVIEWSPQVSTIASRTLSSRGPRWVRALSTEYLYCPVISVDALCAVNRVECIDVLKIDVEGDELRVLAGSRHALRRTKRVVVEFHGRRNASGCKAVLEACGFRIVHADARPVGDLYAERPATGGSLQDGYEEITDRCADE